MPDNSATRGVISSIFSGMFNLGYVVQSLVVMHQQFSVNYWPCGQFSHDNQNSHNIGN